jgi:hypothetical protein
MFSQMIYDYLNSSKDKFIKSLVEYLRDFETRNIPDSLREVLSATKLKTPRLINGIEFDGTADIEIATGGTAVDVFGLDGNGDIMPLLEGVASDFFEYDGSGDIEPTV